MRAGGAMNNDDQSAVPSGDVARIERALRASELNYRRLFEAARDGILILDANTGRIDDVNPFLIELLGFSRDEMIGKTVAELSPSEDEQSNEEIFERLRKQRYIRYEHLPLRTKDGRRIDVEFVSNVYETGGREAIQCSIRDITERKALEATSTRLGAIIESSDAAIIGKDLNSIITSWNKGSEKVFGYTAIEMIGASIMGLIPADRQGEEKLILAKIKRGKTVEHFETIRQTKDGRLINVSVTASPIKDANGSVVGVSKLACDITKQKRSEESLRASEEKFRQLADHITDVFWITSRDLKIIHYMSKGYELIWGRSTASLYAHPLQWSDAILPEDRKRVLSVFAKLMRNQVEVSVEYRIARPDGTIRWIHTRGFQVRDATGKFVRLTGIATDITERKRAEAELLASREQLRALAGRIQAAREEERTHAAREIHDVLAQELTTLKLHVAWLSRRLAGPMDGWKQDILREKIGVMMEMTDKASRSVQRIASELRPVVLDSLGLCAAIEWVAADFQKRTEIRCKARVPTGNVAFDAEHSTALFRILQESLTNITRHAKASKVGIRLRLKADEVTLTIADDGRGIRPNELADARSMGLLGMRERASLLAGKCTIAARRSEGTVVEVRLPVGKAHGGGH
jgi:PAS domain S-box-containing protein